MKRSRRLLLVTLLPVALILASCADSTSSAKPEVILAAMPAHIQKCPTLVQLKKYEAQIDAAIAPQDKARLARELIVALRTSELKNNRCVKQALAFYDKIRAQKGAK